jgi:hypothetical protein
MLDEEDMVFQTTLQLDHNMLDISPVRDPDTVSEANISTQPTLQLDEKTSLVPVVTLAQDEPTAQKEDFDSEMPIETEPIMLSDNKNGKELDISVEMDLMCEMSSDSNIIAEVLGEPGIVIVPETQEEFIAANEPKEFDLNDEELQQDLEMIGDEKLGQEQVDDSTSYEEEQETDMPHVEQIEQAVPQVTLGPVLLVPVASEQEPDQNEVTLDTEEPLTMMNLDYEMMQSKPEALSVPLQEQEIKFGLQAVFQIRKILSQIRILPFFSIRTDPNKEINLNFLTY